MSTNINITVGDNTLVDAAKTNQTANRQSQLEREASQRLKTQATTERSKALAAQGKNATGNSLYGVPIAKPKIDRRPAANRITNQETVSAAFVAYADTDWNRVNSFSYEWTGSNQGPSVWLSSLDGSYWLSDTHIPEGISNWSFLTGAGFNGDIGSSTRYAQISTERRSMQHAILPAGKGNFVLVMRYSQAATANAAFDSATVGQPAEWAITYQQTSEPQETFFSYYVSKSSVKKISTPNPVKNFIRRKLPSITIEEFPGASAGGTWANPLPWKGAWSLPDPNSGYPSERLDISLTLDYLGITPAPSNYISRSSPFIYAMNQDTNADISNFEDSLSGSTAWRNALLNAERLNAPGRLVARHLGIVVNSLTNSDNILQPPVIANNNINLYVIQENTYIDWKTPNWYYLSSAITQNLAFWVTATKIKVPGSSSTSAFIFNAPAEIPATFSDIVKPGKPVADSYTLLCTDWGLPGYCGEQLLALGFTSADLTP